MSNEQNLTSIKELASQLKSSDALIKKIIKDFEIDTIRSQKKVSLSDESVKIIRDILALRASGKKNNEIKEMFYASRDPEATSEETTKTTAEVQVPVAAEEEVEQETSTENKDNTENFQKNPKNKRHKRERKPHREEPADEKLPKLTAEEIAEIQDLSQYLEEEEENKLDDTLKNLLDDSDDEELEDLSEDEEEDDDDEDEERSSSSSSSSSRSKVRRRQFSFRYIQRQIANDSKRVNYIKQKLKRGVLSVKERMLLEDSLYHRSKLLNGWVHLLRWVKS